MNFTKFYIPLNDENKFRETTNEIENDINIMNTEMTEFNLKK